MNLRRFFSRIVPEIDRAPDGIPTWIVESDWQVRERLFVERVTRYLRLATWLMALSIAILIFSLTASIASIEFGIASGGMAADVFADLIWSSAGIPLHEHP